MADQSRLGPVVMPWQQGHYEEILIFVLVGIMGAVVGATLLHHYREPQGRN